MFVSVTLAKLMVTVGGVETVCSIGVECLGQYKEVSLRGGNPSQVTFRAEPVQPKCNANKKRRRRKATRQEEDAAELHGGKRHKGSGVLPYLKSDASTRHAYRMECKSTAGVGIRVQRKDIEKLRSECEPGQVPVFLLQYNEPTTLRTQDEWVMVPKKEWEKRVGSTDD
jgi:hypothetical protein